MAILVGMTRERAIIHFPIRELETTRSIACRRRAACHIILSLRLLMIDVTVQKWNG